MDWWSSQSFRIDRTSKRVDCAQDIEIPKTKEERIALVNAAANLRVSLHDTEQDWYVESLISDMFDGKDTTKRLEVSTYRVNMARFSHELKEPPKGKSPEYKTQAEAKPKEEVEDDRPVINNMEDFYKIYGLTDLGPEKEHVSPKSSSVRFKIDDDNFNDVSGEAGSGPQGKD